MLNKLSTYDNPILDRQIEEIVHVMNTETATPTAVDDAIATAIMAHEAEVNPHPTYLTQAEGDALYPTETASTVGSLIAAATDKTTPVDVDSIAISDSAASNILKKLSWSNLKATLKTYFDTIYTTSAAVVAYVGGITYGRQFAYSHEDHSHTGDLLETTLWSTTIPGGTLGPNGVIRITTLWLLTASANTKTVRIKFGGTSYYSVGSWAAATTTAYIQTIIRNRNSDSSQIGASSALIGPGSTSAANITSSLDTALDQDITITGQLTNTGETITLKDVFIEVLK